MAIGKPQRRALADQASIGMDQATMPALYIIGDSHVSCFAGLDRIVPQYPDVVVGAYSKVSVCRFGPALAGTMHREITSTYGRQKAFAVLRMLEPGSTVFMLMGEIDCRAHIVKRAGFREEAIGESVKSTVANYTSFLDDFRSEAAARQVRVGIISPPPTTLKDIHTRNGPLVEFFMGNHQSAIRRVLLKMVRRLIPRSHDLRTELEYQYLYAGSQALRNLASLTFGKALADYCAAQGLPFVDLMEPFKAMSQDAAAQFFMDQIHLNSKAVAMVAPEFAALGFPNFLPQT